jgi:hypothetical protein
LHFTHNTVGKRYLDASEDEFDEAAQQVFGEMDLVRNPKYGEIQFYDDILDGILMCYRSEACGGATSDEKRIMFQNIDELHQIIYQQMLEDLGNPQLYQRYSRRQWVKNKASLWVQQDLGEGGGTRRKRKFKQELRTLSMQTRTASGGEVGDILDPDQLGTGGGTPVAQKRGRGERSLETGRGQYAYRLENLRLMLTNLQAQAQKTDANSDRTIEMSRRESGEQIIQLLNASAQGKADIVIQIGNILTQLFQQESNLPEDDARANANSTIRGWQEDGANTTTKLVSFFERHPLVQQAMAASATPQAQPSVAPATQPRPAAAAAGPQQTTQAARQIQQVPNDVSQMVMNNDWLKNASLKELTNLMLKFNQQKAQMPEDDYELGMIRIRRAMNWKKGGQ